MPTASPASPPPSFPSPFLTMPKKQSALPASGSKSAATPVNSKPSSTAASKPGANQPPVIGAISLITAAVAATLKQPELIAGIVHAESVSRGAYSAFGKYRYFLEKRLAAEKSSAKITALLREKCGLTAGTISHSAYAAKAFAFVVTDHITEAEYDNMPADLTRAFVQVIAPDAKKRLTIEQAIGYLRSGNPPGEIAEEFDSLSTHGLTLHESEKVAKEQAAKEKKEQEQRAADLQAAEGAKAAQAALAAKAAEDKAKADEQAKKAAAAKKKADAAAKKASTAAEKKAAEAAQKQADADAAAAAAAQDKAKADAKAAKAKPTNITKMPPQGVTLTAVGEQLDKLMESIGKLPVAQQVAFYSTTWKAADALLHDMLKGQLKKAS